MPGAVVADTMKWSPTSKLLLLFLKHILSRLLLTAPQRALPPSFSLNSKLCNLHRDDECEVLAHFTFARVRWKVDAVEARVRDGEDRVRLLGFGEAERRALAVIR